MTWCHVPETGSAYAPEPVVLIWASCSQNPASRPDATSSGRNTHAKPLSQPCARDTSRPLLSGMTSPPSTGAPSEERSTPSLLAIHANHLASPESAREKTMNATCGQTSPGSSEKSDPDGSFLRTSAGMSVKVWKPCCESYETWAGRLAQVYSQRAKLARRMSDSASSSWPTPMAGTPVPSQAANWQTPRVVSGEYTRDRGKKGSERPTLQGQAASWPTPAARDHKGANSPHHLENGTGRRHMDQLPNAVAHGFTHPAPQTVTAGLPSSQWRPTSRHLLHSATSHVALASLRRWLRGGNWRKRRLNPPFAEWLMAWPPGHALCACSATAFTRWRQDMRGALSALPTASAPWIWEPMERIQPEPEQMEMF